MSTIAILTEAFQFNRGRTLATLDEIDKLPDPDAALAFRLAAGRAHIGWQFMHVGITEEIFANERLAADRSGKWAELWPRFRGGSQADDDAPTASLIRQVLAESREELLQTLSGWHDDRLDEVPPALAERKWTFRTVLHIIAWHEAHHQGQAHAMLNAYRAKHL